VAKKKLWRRAWGPFPHAEYRAWHALVRRCTDPRTSNFRDYGGRGITVCDRWRYDFMAFLSDMGPRPSPTHSLDRWDNDAGYTPENCRWATATQQMLNTRRVQRAVGGSYHRGWWTAQINRHGRGVVLGRFRTRAEASLAYREARLRARIAAEIEAMEGLSAHGRDDRE